MVKYPRKFKYMGGVPGNFAKVLSPQSGRRAGERCTLNLTQKRGKPKIISNLMIIREASWGGLGGILGRLAAKLRAIGPRGRFWGSKIEAKMDAKRVSKKSKRVSGVLEGL